MSTTNRSTVMGTFDNRTQAEQAVTTLKQAGFTDDRIGLAGRDEVIEKMQTDASSRTGQALSESVVVTVKAGERWQEAIDILHRQGASYMIPSPDTASEEYSVQSPTQQTTHGDAIAAHLEYDPVAGPRLTTENTAPIDTGGYGLKRDPALDTDTSTGDPNVRANTTTEEEGRDTFFGQTVEPTYIEPGSPDDPDTRSPHVG